MSFRSAFKTRISGWFRNLEATIDDAEDWQDFDHDEEPPAQLVGLPDSGSQVPTRTALSRERKNPKC